MSCSIQTFNSHRMGFFCFALMVGGYLNTDNSAWERMLVVPETVLEMERDAERGTLSGAAFFCSPLNKTL